MMGEQLKSLIRRKWRLGVPLILLGGSLGWVCADRLVGVAFERVKPHIERGLAKPLARPITIGVYRGLRPWGISIDKTEFLSGKKDYSTAKFSGLDIKFAPISSLFNWRPVIVIKPYGSTVSLRTNENGKYFVTS